MRKNIIAVIAVVLLVFWVLGGCGSVKSETKAVQPASGAKQSENILFDSGPEEKDRQAAADLQGMDRKVARQISLVIIVPDLEKAVSQLEELVKGSGGYIQNADMWQTNDRMMANLTMRVPVEKMEDLLPRIEGIGRLERKNIAGKDVTEEYYDATARKSTLERQEKRLLELLNKAGTVKEMLEIENELSRVRGQVESLQARLKVLDNLTSLATISVELRVPKTVFTGETLKEPFSQRIKAAWMRGVNGMTNSVEELVTLAVMLIPYIPLIAAAGYVFYRVWKKRQAKS